MLINPGHKWCRGHDLQRAGLTHYRSEILVNKTLVGWWEVTQSGIPITAWLFWVMILFSFQANATIEKLAERRCEHIRLEAQVCELVPAPTQVCMFVDVCSQMVAGVCVCVCVWWDADIALASLQSDPFGRESRTNQIIVLVWHWVDPSVGQWADYPGWEWEWLNSELHTNEYIMSPLSLSTLLWNKEMRSTSALMKRWNSASLLHHKAKLMAMQITFSNTEIGVETGWEYGWDTSNATQGGWKI